MVHKAEADPNFVDQPDWANSDDVAAEIVMSLVRRFGIEGD